MGEVFVVLGGMNLLQSAAVGLLQGKLGGAHTVHLAGAHAIYHPGHADGDGVGLDMISPVHPTSPAQPKYPTQVIRLTYSSGLRLW